MANELVQGLLQDLLQPRKGPAPADIMAAISSKNPMAAVAAMQAPQLSQMFGQQFRGLIGGLRGQPAPQTADEAMAAATQQIAAQPDLMNSSVGLNKMAQAAFAVGRTAEAMQFSLMAAEMEREEDKRIKDEEMRLLDIRQAEAQIGLLDAQARAATAKASPAELTPKEKAALYRYFTPESIGDYLADPSAPLVRVADSSSGSSNYAKQLKESGLVEGSPEFMQAMRDYNTSMVQGNLEQTTPLETIATLNDALVKIPTSAQTAEDAATLRRIKDTLPALEGTNPQAYTVITASLPMLYQSNARAASEIDSFRERRGIAESFGDWITKIAGGTATKETKDNLRELVNILDASIASQHAREVSSVASGYRGIVEQGLLDKWIVNQHPDALQDVESIVNSILGQGPR